MILYLVRGGRNWCRGQGLNHTASMKKAFVADLPRALPQPDRFALLYTASRMAYVPTLDTHGEILPYHRLGHGVPSHTILDITRGDLPPRSWLIRSPSHSDFTSLSHSRGSLRYFWKAPTSKMTIRWLKGGCQGVLSQGNPDSDDTSTWLNGSIRPHLEKIELVSYPCARLPFPEITVSNRSTSHSPKAIRMIPESQCRYP